MVRSTPSQPHTLKDAGLSWLLAATLALTAAGCASRPSTVRPPVGPHGVLETRMGLASFYGREFHGKRMASGAAFDMNAMVAAHPTYPFGTIVRVTNLANDRFVRVKILDRGPARRARVDGVIIDVSQGAARKLGFVREGRTRVRLDVLKWGRQTPS
jgi:rare lipoprotein A